MANKDWWSQAMSAVVFLATAAIVLAMLRQQSHPVIGVHHPHAVEADSPPPLHIPNLPDVTPTKIDRDTTRPEQPIVGADLTYLPITDASLKSLSELRQLKSLSLRGTRVSAEGVRLLRERRPDLACYWSAADE
jgi:hypothetical protein